MALAALNIDYGRREFILDSGADVWHLRASNESEFEVWKTRLETVWLKAVAGRKRNLQDQQDGHEISSEWRQVEGLVDRLEMMKDFVKGMVQDLTNEGVKRHESLSASRNPEQPRDLKAKDGKERKGIFRKKDKPAPPPSPTREQPATTLNILHGAATSSDY